MAKDWQRLSTLTPSEHVTGSWPAKFSDGQSARSWPCRVRLDDRGVLIERDGTDEPLIWPYGAIRTPHPLSRGATEAILGYAHMPNAQLLIGDSEFVAQLSRHAPGLTTSAHRWRWAGPLIGVAMLIVAAFALIWLLELRLARTIAGMLPETSRQTVGRNVIASFTDKYKVCTNPDGRAALDTLTARLLKGVAKPEYFKITVVNWGLVNAFAAPGGQMVLTSGLIRKARSPEEVAGVLAHEIGHGVELHPETGLVRALGLSALVELMTGGSSGALSNLTALLVQNSYVRADESAADQQALALLRQASISQQGLADFFQRIGGGDKAKSDSAGKSDGDGKSGPRQISFGAFDLLRTHPYPEERARIVRATPSYPTTPALTNREWRALKAICSG